MEIKEDSGKVVMGRAEIDTRAPFKSVKEAVILFGERVLVKEIYGSKLKEMQAAASFENGHSDKSRIGVLTAELEEAKQNLQKTREEITMMSDCSRTLKEELEETKKELKQLMKTKEYHLKQPVESDPGIEDIKFIESSTGARKGYIIRTEEEEYDYEKKRDVKFASSPSLAQMIVSKEEKALERSFKSPKKTIKKKPFTMPLIGWLFSVKRSAGGQEVNSPRSK